MSQSSTNLFNKNYQEWKNWSDNDFGRLTLSDKRYFSVELHRIGFSLHENSRVMEIGFGNGAFLAYSNKMKWNTLGVEVNDDLISLAKRCGYESCRYDNIGNIVGNQFDLIVAFDVLEHMTHGEINLLIATIGRLLKSGGIFLARFPNGDSPLGMPNQNGDVTHVTSIGSRKISYYLHQLLGEIIYIGGEAQPILGLNLIRSFWQLVLHIIRKIINFMVRSIFFPRTKLEFCSQNLVVIFKKA